MFGRTFKTFLGETALELPLLSSVSDERVGPARCTFYGCDIGSAQRFEIQ